MLLEHYRQEDPTLYFCI